jgi:hypothetical protein
MEFQTKQEKSAVAATSVAIDAPVNDCFPSSAEPRQGRDPSCARSKSRPPALLAGSVLVGSGLIAAAISSSGERSSRRIPFRGEDDALESFKVNDE